MLSVLSQWLNSSFYIIQESANFLNFFRKYDEENLILSQNFKLNSS